MAYQETGPAGIADLLSREDVNACHEAIRTGSKSFHAASLLLPSRIRLAAMAIYSFCRDADDFVDLGNGSASAAGELLRRLDAIARGKPGDRYCDRAFHAAVEAYRIPVEIPRALVEGFEWDERGKRYETFDDLASYAARVASTVGIMMTVVMGSRDRNVLARAAELGLAMQLTNIARDVGEDARAGRIYLPLSWLSAEGIDPSGFLDKPAYSPALANVVRRLLATADGYYARAFTGLGGLPPVCRPAIAAAALIYREIGREIERNGHDSVTVRARVSAPRKAALVAQALPAMATLSPVGRARPHPSLEFLVEATARPATEPSGFDAAAGRFIEILTQAARHEQRMTELARVGGRQ